LIAANWQMKKESKDADKLWEMPVVPTKATRTETADTREETVKVEEPIVETEEMLDIVIDEPTKDWEPELYARVEPAKEMGRYEAELAVEKQKKTKSFLSKAEEIIKNPSSIEAEVEKLQNEKGRM
jgi:hypothetical protein